jgi:hypothetical protein
MTKPDPNPTLRALQGAHRATHSHFLISTHHGKRDRWVFKNKFKLNKIALYDH